MSARGREGFAGVRSIHDRDAGDKSELACCAYGKSCTLFQDDVSAASLDTDQHLQAWLGDEQTMVDRYDVRLLLHDTRQTGRANTSAPGQIESDEEEAIEYERYRDLNAVSASNTEQLAKAYQPSGWLEWLCHG